MAEGLNVSGTERAAILLLTLGEDAAASILRHMDVDEVQRLGSAMATLSDVPRDRVATVLGDLLVAVEQKTPIGLGTADYLRNVLTSSLGERKAGSLLDRILQGRESSGIDALKWMDPRAVAGVIRDEHPQILATILAHLNAQQAARVMEHLAPDQQVEVAMRLARLEEVPETALKELDAIVEKQTQEAAVLRTSRLGGVKATADILNLMDPETEGRILEGIRGADDALGDSIQDSLFVFENLLGVDDRGIQTILREVQSDTLSKALKGADVAIQEKIFRNMSKRAAELLRDDMTTRGPIRLAEVEEAQKEILGVAQRLAEEGQVMLGGGGEEFV